MCFSTKNDEQQQMNSSNHFTCCGNGRLDVEQWQSSWLSWWTNWHQNALDALMQILLLSKWEQGLSSAYGQLTEAILLIIRSLSYKPSFLKNMYMISMTSSMIFFRIWSNPSFHPLIFTFIWFIHLCSCLLLECNTYLYNWLQNCVFIQLNYIISYYST